MKSGKQLRYIDQKRMGQVYYIAPDQRSEIVRLENKGPDVIDEPFSLDEFNL
jgi:formamidopyrimidine-DNA glycosylase